MNDEPLLLDLYCCAGGASEGYRRAGFRVVGVDISPQPNYPFPFMQHDAIELLDDIISYGIQSVLGDLDGWYPVSAIAASPPCHDHTKLSGQSGTNGTGWLLAATRDRLQKTGLPWVLENVPGAALRADYRLCGCMFGLPGLRRDRWFETSWHGFDMRPPCHHTGRAVTVTGHAGGYSNRDKVHIGSVQQWKEAMGIDWMTGRELSQAIPPAYTEYVGTRLLAQLQVAA